MDQLYMTSQVVSNIIRKTTFSPISLYVPKIKQSSVKTEKTKLHSFHWKISTLLSLLLIILSDT